MKCRGWNGTDRKPAGILHFHWVVTTALSHDNAVLSDLIQFEWRKCVKIYSCNAVETTAGIFTGLALQLAILTVLCTTCCL